MMHALHGATFSNLHGKCMCAFHDKSFKHGQVQVLMCFGSSAVTSGSDNK